MSFDWSDACIICEVLREAFRPPLLTPLFK